MLRLDALPPSKASDAKNGSAKFEYGDVGKAEF